MRDPVCVCVCRLSRAVETRRGIGFACSVQPREPSADKKSLHFFLSSQRSSTFSFAFSQTQRYPDNMLLPKKNRLAVYSHLLKGKSHHSFLCFCLFVWWVRCLLQPSSLWFISCFVHIKSDGAHCPLQEFS